MIEKDSININRIHTTPMGEKRIKRNLGLPDNTDVVDLCLNRILDRSAHISRKGKNLYIISYGQKFTIHANSMTIITAHEMKS